VKLHLIPAALCLLTPLQYASAQTHDNPFGVPCEGWSNGWAYPGSSDCMWNDNEDKEFARRATLRGITDLELARLAEQKASSPAVKQFAQQIVNDQGTANDELKRVAGSSSITTPEAVDSKHKAEIARLASLDGPAFDRAYIADQLSTARETSADFTMRPAPAWTPASKTSHREPFPKRSNTSRRRKR
jgi:predicted outer membrane protein